MTEKTLKRQIGIRIMQRRKQLNLTQAELAEQLEISDSQISNIERGKYFPKMTNIVKLCAILDCNADYIFSGVLKHSVADNIIDLVSSLSIEEQKIVLLLIDTYIHRNTNEQN